MIKIQKNAYQGKRCFIIASGPSIAKMDLSPLKNEITICMNQSFKALDWEPTFICIGDRELWVHIKDTYAAMNSMIVCSSGLNGQVGEDYEGSNLVVKIPLIKSQSVEKNGFNYHLHNGVNKAYGVIPEIVLPFVCWAGFYACYIIGCDCTDAGYFFKEGFRMDKQKVLPESLRSMEIISQTELPTKIYNSTRGGNLHCFPRVPYTSLFPGYPFKSKVNKRDLLVIGYYTPNNDYKQRAENMQRSVSAQKLNCEIKEYKSLAYLAEDKPKPMPWVLNCSLCSTFISDMRKLYPDTDLLYLDADSEMIRRPELFLDEERDFDFAAPVLSNKYVQNELVSNTLYFAATPAANELLNLWTNEQQKRNMEMLIGRYTKPFRPVWDQQVLQDMMKFVPELKYKQLPWEYAKIDLTPKGEELMEGVDPNKIVIMQYQASRQNKRAV